MPTSPPLIEVTRGPLVESRHHVALAIVRADGEPVLTLGDVATPVFARSTIKAFQAFPVLDTGAAARFAYADDELALACASHTGSPTHTALAEAMLARAGLAAAALRCGAHAPLATVAAHDLVRAGHAPGPVHNNCSGKHAAMLATAVHMGEPVDGYEQASHPVQQRILGLLRDLSGLPLGPDVTAVDGCSLPTYALPLPVLAAMFARLVTGSGLSAERAHAATRLCAACWRRPELVAGPGRLDTIVMAAFPGQIFLKTGAEGVYAGAIPGRALGFAVKAEDGAARAAIAALAALLDQLMPEAGRLVGERVLRNWRGHEVGMIRPGETLRASLATLPSRL